MKRKLCDGKIISISIFIIILKAMVKLSFYNHIIPQKINKTITTRNERGILFCTIKRACKSLPALAISTVYDKKNKRSLFD